MTDAILVLLVLIALVALEIRDLIASIVLLSVFSLLSCLLFYLLHAPDVALTEAAVGTGIGTVVLIWAVFRTERRDTT
jgi:energy-converting hydrogenase B subunit D